MAKSDVKPNVERGTEKKALGDVKGERKEKGEEANERVKNKYNN